MFDPSLLPKNEIDSHVVLPEAEDKLNVSPLPPANLVSSPLLLTNH